METIVHDVEIFKGDQLSNEQVKVWQQEMMAKSGGKFEIVRICLSGDNPTLAIHYKIIIEQIKESTRRVSQCDTFDVNSVGGGFRRISR